MLSCSRSQPVRQVARAAGRVVNDDACRCGRSFFGTATRLCQGPYGGAHEAWEERMSRKRQSLRVKLTMYKTAGYALVGVVVGVFRLFVSNLASFDTNPALKTTVNPRVVGPRPRTPGH